MSRTFTASLTELQFLSYSFGTIITLELSAHNNTKHSIVTRFHLLWKVPFFLFFFVVRAYCGTDETIPNIYLIQLQMNQGDFHKYKPGKLIFFYIIAFLLFLLLFPIICYFMSFFLPFLLLSLILILSYSNKLSYANNIHYTCFSSFNKRKTVWAFRNKKHKHRFKVLQSFNGQTNLVRSR